VIILRNSIWVIKVTYLATKAINFNEGYRTWGECRAAILKKIEPDGLKIIDEFTFRDLNEDVEYTGRVVDIY